MARSCVNHLVYVGQREAILRTGFIWVGKVNADPLFPILLFHQDWIGEPVWIKSFLDETSFEESVYFLVERLTFCIHLPRLLLYWFCF